jgi:hypothetical protein
MPLSRLENFLKNAEGNILYVNQSDFDATDSFENRGNSLTRPFRTIQRALIEAARFSYLPGKNNDKIDNTTILVFPGTNYIDNRPGFSITNIDGSAEIRRLVNGTWITSGAVLNEFGENSNFDIFDEDNDLYKYNSINGGVILPRGTSIVGLDLRKTKIRPLYVPDPINDNVAPSAIFRVTGTCYFSAFSIFDADTNRPAYKDSSGIKVSPNFSHHKLTCFEYADGINNSRINDDILDETDLEMFYAKVTYAYGDLSGRGLSRYPSPTGVDDFEPSIDEYRIVGDLRADPVGIVSIRSGDGNIPTQVITVTTARSHGLFKDTPVLITGITTDTSSYNGSQIVSDVISSIEFQYVAPNTPTTALPSFTQIINASASVQSDSVSSASPYIFSCTLRSVLGMNGMFADGSKATGFKSMLVAQFTGISLQKDDRAFLLYDPVTNSYNDDLTVDDSEKPLHVNSRSVYRPGWESTHIKASNNSIFQCVSVFAIGYARHFVAETGGDMSITNSNSNFGAVSLEANGFRPESFDRDDVGYITHIIPPREPIERISSIGWVSLDVEQTIGAATTERLYLFGYNNIDIPPSNIIDGYKVGAKRGEELYLPVIINNNETILKAPILMEVPPNAGISTSSEKIYTLGRTLGINSITNNILTLTENHQLINGEKIRIYSDTGELPFGINDNTLYYALTSGLPTNQLKLATSLNEAIVENNVKGISNNGGILKIISTVSDKLPGEAGHPVQFDNVESQWYLLVSEETSSNTIYSAIVGLGTTSLGKQTATPFITRKADTRSLDEKLYKFRYVIPKEFQNSRPPTDGFILQESKSVGIGSVSFLNSIVTDPTQLRNPKIIIDALYNDVTETVTIRTEAPHNFVVGDIVKIANVVSTDNDGTEESYNEVPYNGLFKVESIINSRTFTYSGIKINPGNFLNRVNERNTQQQVESLPTVQREKYKDTVYIYRTQELKKLIPGPEGQDGVYNIIPICGSIKPNSTIGFGISERGFSQDIKNLYPQQDRDNLDSDPPASVSHANIYPVGKIATNDKRNSITKESVNYFLQNSRIGFAITGVTISGAGNTTITLFTDTPHNFNSIKRLTILDGGTGYNNNAGVTTTLYSAELLNPSIIGNFGAVRAVVSAGNTISSVTIVDGGSAYSIGNIMTISADPADSPITDALVEVVEINNVVGDTLELTGFYEPRLNGTFKIISVSDPRSISIFNPNAVGSAYTQRNDERLPQIYLSSTGVGISTIIYTSETGITTVTSNTSHGLLPGNSFVLVGVNNQFFQRKFFVTEIVGLTTFTFSAGIGTLPQFGNTNGVTLHKQGLSSNGRFYGTGEENLGGRGSFLYAGISTNLSVTLTSTSTTINLSNSNGFYKGDYILIDSEIIRLSSDPTNNSFPIIRGQFSTVSAQHIAGSIVRKIRVLPMEIRRHSILRASGHTFEYLGYGPGNYSTALPVNQDRLLSDDEILVSQAREQSGGSVVYTGMNDRGEFFNGATKLNGATGVEEVIDAPIVSIFGDDLFQNLTRRTSGVYDDLLVKERLTVEGGENNNQASQFNGPVNFSSKITSTSEDGVELRDLLIRGTAAQPKVITVGISTPTTTAKSGDISLAATPEQGGFIGHVYSNNDWKRFGMISRERNRDFLIVDQIGVGQSAGIYNFTDAMEVNGTLKVRNLFVGGAVTFSGAQAIADAEFDRITLNQTQVFVGQSTNYTIITQNPNTIAQFQNIEVIGSAVTFTGGNVSGGIGPTFTINNELVSNHTGVSTFKGSLKVEGLIVVQDFFQVNRLIVNSTEINTLGVVTEAFIPSGIITAARMRYLGGFGNAGAGQTEFRIFANSGFVTSITGTSATITTFNSTNGFFTNARAEVLTTPQLLALSGIVTNISGTNLNYTNSTIGLGTFSNLNVTNNVTTKTLFVDSGITTYITGIAATFSLVTAGVIDTPSISVSSGTFNNLTVTSRLSLPGTGADEGIYANIGIITQFGSGTRSTFINAGPAGVVTATRYRSTTSTGTAPLEVTSTTKVINLNADLLDGYDTAISNTPNTIVVRDQFGNFQAGVITATKIVADIEGTVTQPEGSFYRVSQGYFSSGGNAAILSTNVYSTNAGSSYVNANSTAGVIYIQSGQNHRWLKHNGASTPVTTQLLDLTTDGNLTATGFVQANSDIKLKKNIKTIENALDKVCQLRGVEYDRIDKESHEIGVIAQEVEEVFPDLVKENEDGIKSVAYGNLVAALIESVKELKEEITELKSEIAQLKSDK